METIETALHAAETGHLVFSTLHTLDATETINRIISVFPPHQQKQVRLQLASVLKAAVAQRLIPRADLSARVPAVEVLIATPFVRDCIVDKEKTHLIKGAIAQGTSQYGMQTFDQSIFSLFSQGLVTYEEALRWASNVDEFKLKIQGISTTAELSRDQMASTILGRKPRPPPLPRPPSVRQRSRASAAESGGRRRRDAGRRSLHPRAAVAVGARAVGAPAAPAPGPPRGRAPRRSTRSIARLQASGVLDESRMARAAARLETVIRGRGPARARQKLRALGLADTDVERALDAALEDVDVATLLDRALDKRLRRERGDLADPATVRKIVGSLVRQGFAPVRSSPGFAPGRLATSTTAD